MSLGYVNAPWDEVSHVNFFFISTNKTKEDTVQVPTTSNRSINVWRGRKKMNNDINGVQIVGGSETIFTVMRQITTRKLPETFAGSLQSLQSRKYRCNFGWFFFSLYFPLICDNLSPGNLYNRDPVQTNAQWAQELNHNVKLRLHWS